MTNTEESGAFDFTPGDGEGAGREVDLGDGEGEDDGVQIVFDAEDTPTITRLDGTLPTDDQLPVVTPPQVGGGFGSGLRELPTLDLLDEEPLALAEQGIEVSDDEFRQVRQDMAARLARLLSLRRDGREGLVSMVAEGLFNDVLRFGVSDLNNKSFADLEKKHPGLMAGYLDAFAKNAESNERVRTSADEGVFKENILRYKESEMILLLNRILSISR